MSHAHRRAIKAWVERWKLRPRAAVRLANLDVSAVSSDLDVSAVSSDVDVSAVSSDVDVSAVSSDVDVGELRWRYSERVEGVPGGVMSFGDGL